MPAQKWFYRRIDIKKILGHIKKVKKGQEKERIQFSFLSSAVLSKNRR
jgi:hypothetical protein